MTLSHWEVRSRRNACRLCGRFLVALRCRLAHALAPFLVCLLPIISFAQEKEPRLEQLIKKGSFPEKWSYFSSEKTSKLENTWSLGYTTDTKIPVLKCTGKPSGYLRTKASYDNFEMTLEWMYPGDPNCNSGILIHCGVDKIWPASIQVQLHRPFAGSIFPLKGAETTNRVTVKNLKLDTGKWHTCRIKSDKGTISLWINEKKVGEVNGCKPAHGFIALQSEGSEIHFRRLVIKNLNPPKKTQPKKPPPVTTREPAGTKQKS